MAHDGYDAGTAARAVGYESASQFSREFKRLFGATAHTMNLRLVEGIIAGCDQPQAHAELNPHPDRCCVVVRGALSPGAQASPTPAPSSEREVQ